VAAAVGQHRVDRKNAARLRLEQPRTRENRAHIEHTGLQSLADGYCRVELPHTLARRYSNACRELFWPFVFPQEHRRPTPTFRTGALAASAARPTVWPAGPVSVRLNAMR